MIGGAILLSVGLPYLPGEVSSGVPPLPQVGALITVLVPLGFIAFGRRRRSLVGGFLLLVVGLGLGLFVLLRMQADTASFSDVVILLPLAALVTLSGLAALIVRWIVTAVRRRRDGHTHPRHEPAVPAPTPQPATRKRQPASHGPVRAGPAPTGHEPVSPGAAREPAGQIRTTSTQRRYAWLAASAAAVIVFVLGLAGASPYEFVTQKIIPALSTFGGFYAVVTGAASRQQRSRRAA